MRGKLVRIVSGLLVFAVMMSYSIVLPGGAAVAGSDKGVSKVMITNVQGKKITLGKGKKMKLKAKVVLKKGRSASKKVTYKSSNPSIVTVSKSGVMKAKKIGKAKVTVQSKANGKKKVTVTVKVAKKNLLIKKISLKKSLTLHIPVGKEDEDEDDASESVGEDTEDTEDAEDEDEDNEEEDDEDEEEDDVDDEITYSLNAQISPSNASNQNLKWTSSNKEVVTVDQDGKITVVDAGKAVITVKATDGSKKKATCQVTVIDDADDDDDTDNEDESEE